VIFLAKSNLALTMVFGEKIQSQLEEIKVIVKIVSNMNLIKIDSFKKETNKGAMSMTALASMEVSVLKI
jgi:hypothetical protein